MRLAVGFGGQELGQVIEFVCLDSTGAGIAKLGGGKNSDSQSNNSIIEIKDYLERKNIKMTTTQILLRSLVISIFCMHMNHGPSVKI